MAPELPQELVDNVVDLVAFDLEQAKLLPLTSRERDEAYAAMLNCHTLNRAFRASARPHIFKHINLTFRPGITQPQLLAKIRQFHEILQSNPTLRLCIRSLEISTSSEEDAQALTSFDNGLPQIVTSLYSTPGCPIDQLTLRGRSDAVWTHTTEEFRLAIYSLLKSGSIKHLTIEEIQYIPAIIFSQIASCLDSLSLVASTFTGTADLKVLECIGKTPAAQPAQLNLCQFGTLPLETPRRLYPAFFSAFLARVEVLRIRQHGRAPQSMDGTPLWGHVTKFLEKSPVKELHVIADHFFLPPIVQAITFTPLKHLVHFEFTLRSPPQFSQFATAKIETIGRTNTTHPCPTLQTAKFTIHSDAVAGFEDGLFHKDVCNHMFMPFFDEREKFPNMRRIWVEFVSPDYGPMGASRSGEVEYRDNTPPLGQLKYIRGVKLEVSKKVGEGKFVIDVKKVS